MSPESRVRLCGWAQPLPRRSPRETPHASGSSLHILVVAHAPDVREAVTRTLTEARHNVVTAETTHEAERVLEYATPDLIFLDGALPAMDGGGLCKIITSDGMFDPVLVVFMATPLTAMAQGQEEGARAFIMPPIQQEVLLAQVNAVARFKRLTDQRDRALMLQGERINSLTNENLQLQDMFEHVGNHEKTYHNIAAPTTRGGNVKKLIVFMNEMGRILKQRKSERAITERKRAEEALHASLKEKEVLLKEIHHRVKNNLAVISSLLSLQERVIDNELVSNGLKHAFRDRERGTIRITMEKHDDQFTLTVADDGVGIPRDFDVHSATTLGLELVESLTKQLDGAFDVVSEGGTAFRLTFSEVVQKERT